MGHLDVGGVRLWVEDTGGDGPVVAFSHGLLMDSALFRAQIDALRGRYRCIAWDHRGQGRSEIPDVRCIDLDTLTADALALFAALGVGPVHFVGLSMGGFVGMRLAARHPACVRSLALLETAADPEPWYNVPKYRVLAAIAARFGVRPRLVRLVAKIMLGRTFLTDPARAAERDAVFAHFGALDRRIVRAVNGVIEREGVEGELARIACPTLVVWGSEDVAIARSRALGLVRGIPGATWRELPAAGHSSALEQPAAVTAALAEFLETVA